jgi:hypothetical protein
MKPLVVLAFALSLVAHTQLASAKPPKLESTGPDSARAVYPDKCANGANHDDANRDAFVKAMLDNPKSKLAQAKAALLEEIKDDIRGEGVYLGAWQQTYHDRVGCGTSKTSLSAVMVTVTGGNSSHTVTRYLVTIDDDDDDGVRTFALRSLTPLKLRDEIAH